MCLSFACIKNYFGIYCQNEVYIIYYVYWILSIHTMLQMYFNILFLYLYKFIEKSDFHFNVWILENMVFGFCLHFLITKIVQLFIICVNFLSHIFVLQSIYMNLFLWNLWDLNRIFKGFYKSHFITYKTLIWAAGGRPTGRAKLRSVNRLVD